MSDNSPRDSSQEYASTFERLRAPHFLGIPQLSASLLTSLPINSASDRTSDVRSQSESQSQTPGGSTSSRHRQQHTTDNPRRTKATSLSHYKNTEIHAPLLEAKELFSATAFASGCFFYHQHSPYIEAFQTYARDAIAQAANAHEIKVPLDKNMMNLVYNTLGSRRSALKKDARVIVERQYALRSVEGGDNHMAQTEAVVLKVGGLLDDSGGFTDGPSDHNGNPGRWNHPCCLEIIAKFLFDKPNSLGCKFTARFGPPLTAELVAFGHTMAYNCLEEWVTGKLISRDLNVLDSERKYNNILAGIRVAENDPYAGPLMEAMYSDWWDNLTKRKDQEITVPKNVAFKKTYGPPPGPPPSPPSLFQNTLPETTLPHAPFQHAMETNHWDMLESDLLQNMASTSTLNFFPSEAASSSVPYYMESYNDWATKNFYSGPGDGL